MKKFLISLLLMLPLVLSAEAQQKIGIVNTAVIMEALPDVKAATTKIQDLAKQYDAEIKRMQDEMKTKLEASSAGATGDGSSYTEQLPDDAGRNPEGAGEAHGSYPYEGNDCHQQGL